MADYIYLLENRLSGAQQAALHAVREVARSEGLTVFLVGGAVRDLTSGSPVRDLDVVVQGNAFKLKKKIELAGGTITGETASGQALFVRFAGGVRVEIGSTLSVTYPKPGKPVAHAATILDDLRRRDFTANAMALSLNEGSYGLLMDPLNGVADIENRQLRLVSNYGFIEDPVRMVRAARFSARLGWAMDEKTQARYETGKQEKYITALSDFHRGYETEEIFHEEDPLRILRKLEEEGWMGHIFPALTVAKANAAELEKLREVQTQLQMRGILPEAAAANFPLLAAKLTAPEIGELKRSFVRPGFVTEIESLEGEAKEFAAQLGGKAGATASQSWKLIVGGKPEAVLWVAYSSKSPAIQAKLKSFYTEWPQVRNKIPYTLMQEMRIVPELPGFDDLVDKLFFELLDGRLGTAEEMKAFLEVYSPPAPPPPVHLRRPRAPKKDAKAGKSRKKAVSAEDLAPDEDTPVTDDDATVPDDEDTLVPREDADDTEADGVSLDEVLDPLEDADDPLDEAEDDFASVPAPSPAVKSPPSPAVKVAASKELAKAPAPGKMPAAKSVVNAAPAKAVAKKAVKAAEAKKVAPAVAVPAKKSVPARKSAPPEKKVATKAAPAKAVKKAAASPAKPPAKKTAAKVPPKKVVAVAKAVPAKKAAKAPAKKGR